MMDKIAFTKLQNAMSAYAKVNWFKFDELGGNQATGLFCTATADIKKDKAMENAKKIIKDFNYTFTITEKGLENTKHFEIKF